DFGSLEATDLEPFLALPFEHPETKFWTVNSFFDHQSPLYGEDRHGLCNLAADPLDPGRTLHPARGNRPGNAPISAGMPENAAFFEQSTLPGQGVCLYGDPSLSGGTAAAGHPGLPDPRQNTRHSGLVPWLSQLPDENGRAP